MVNGKVESFGLSCQWIDEKEQREIVISNLNQQVCAYIYIYIVIQTLTKILESFERWLSLIGMH